jgi:orotate phosphoribosyltransferase
MTFIMNDISQKAADLLLSIDAVSFRFDPPFTYTSGLKSPIYLDNRLVMSYPVVRRQIVDLYIQVIKDKIGIENVECVSATASAAIPQGAWVADRLNLPMVYVRPSTKKYGKANRLEGRVEKGSKVVVIEDHISTAESVVGNVETVRELGGIVEYCVATTTYETKKSLEALNSVNVKLFTLTTGKLIIDRAVEKGILTTDQKESVDAWFSDPEGWGVIV